MSEDLIFASINPKYDNRLFMVIPWTIYCHTYYGLVDATISASEKDLPVSKGQRSEHFWLSEAAHYG